MNTPETHPQIQTLFAALSALPTEYVDEFCIGWNRARCGDDQQSTQELQASNATHYKRLGLDPGNAMLDGWSQRQALVNRRKGP